MERKQSRRRTGREWRDNVTRSRLCIKAQTCVLPSSSMRLSYWDGRCSIWKSSSEQERIPPILYKVPALPVSGV